MKILNKNKWLLILALIVLVSIFAFFHRIYRHDMNSLENFVVAYKKFDTAPTPESLKVLQTAAQMRISSLIKNEKQAMTTARAIADLAKQELSNPSLKTQRQAAFAGFQELGK